MKTNTKKATRSDYVTRTQAVRHLQVTLADFRRLCILKGIYPREVTGKSKTKLTKGSTKPITAYNRKDIQYLLHEPLLAKFRAHKIFAKKLSRALGRGDVSDARRLDTNRPRYTLDHLVKERYPTFIDALGDLDDALSTLFLFAAMPATDKVSYRVTQDAERLTNEWMAYVAREKLLRKVFVSIKGVYYQANVRGQDVLWLVPFKFPQNIPSDIDFKIMLTFLEFYTTLTHFVLFRLYTDVGLVYPPPIDKNKIKGVGGISAYILDSQTKTSALPEVEVSASNDTQTVDISLDRARAADEADEDSDAEDADEEEEKLDEFTAETEDADKLAQPTGKGTDSLFSKFNFFVGREVPLDIVEFLILAAGGRFTSESSIDELIDNEDENQSNNVEEAKKKLNLDNITHQICDRPAIHNKVPGRVYVQPQWLFDSINQGELLPVGQYAPGEPLPPHMSPWGDRGNYNPDEDLVRGEDDEDEDEDDEDEAADVAADAADEDDEDEEAAEDEETQKELQLEAAGVKYSEAPKESDKSKKRKAKATPEQEEKELRKLMMTGKQKKLYERMQYGNNKKQARDDALRKKRRKIEKLKEQL